MRHSVARRLTLLISLILLLAFAILFTVGFVTVYRSVTERYASYSKAIVNVYADLILYRDGNTDPLDTEHTEPAISYGNYVCQWYNIDYAYLYVPDVEAGTVTYVCASKNERLGDENFPDHLIGVTHEYVLSPGELEVWNGERDSMLTEQNNANGHELSTIIRITDFVGNNLIAGVDISYDVVYRNVMTSFTILAAVIFAVMLGVYFFVFFLIRKKVSRPARLISSRMNDYVAGGTHTPILLDEKSNDEFAMIARAFNRMAENIDEYLGNIGTLTREKERRNAEFDIAARIQRGFLPAESFDAPDAAIRASMRPAREVGGDLYDYLPLDNHRILTVIADVSGKGIPAAMFMSVTLTLIRQYATMNLSPADLLKKVNALLSANNTALLFATAFVGIYDSDAGQYVYSNAGHNPPYLVGGNGVRALDAPPGTPLGLFEDETYTEHSIPLAPGDTVFLYTDGVNEATDPSNRFFGTERLESLLRASRKTPEKPLTELVGDAVREFAGSAEQHDDVTMLTLTARQTAVLEPEVNVRELTRIKDAILSLPIPRRQQLELCLAAEEYFVNICSYAFPDGVPEGERVRVSLSVSDRVILRFEDGGQPYDPLKDTAAPDDYDLDAQIGGLGKFIARSNVDDVRYEYLDRKNVLTITKMIEEESK